MPRYLVEREFPEEFRVPVDERGARVEDVVWIHSYVSIDKKKTFCIYEAPSPEAIRRVANRNKLSLTRITEVLMLDPFFYR